MHDIENKISAFAPKLLSILRFITGLIFLEHGTGKFLGFPTLPTLPTTFSMSWWAGLLELVGGASLAFGLFTRPVAFLLSGEMAVAYFSAHAPRSLFPMLNGGDAAILYCFVFFYLVFAGGGPWSLDALRGPENQPTRETGATS